MIQCYLGLGSNLKSPERQLRLAIKKLQFSSRITVKKIARFYQNKAWGRQSQPNFTNTVILITTNFPPHKLLKICLDIEAEQGRYRRVKWGARTLDIDIITYGIQRISTSKLQIPHPESSNRDFVQIPLKEITEY